MFFSPDDATVNVIRFKMMPTIPMFFGLNLSRSCLGRSGSLTSKSTREEEEDDGEEEMVTILVMTM